jgi:hypothetical protein
MKKTVLTNSTFNPATRVVDTNISNFDIRNLYAIINQTAETLIYATGTLGKGFTSISGSSITLEFDTTSMNSTDILQIIYDDSEDIDLLQNIFDALDTLTFLSTLRTTSGSIRVALDTNQTSIINNVSALQQLSVVSTQAFPAPSMPSLNMVIHQQNLVSVQSNINNIQNT